MTFCPFPEKAGSAPFLLNGGACVGERTAYDYSEIEYPDDCIVDFDMRLIDLFREMDKKSSTFTYSLPLLIRSHDPTAVKTQ